MGKVNNVKCPECLKEFLRTTKQLNAVIRQSGKWTCQSCSTSIRNRLNSKPIGTKRTVKKSGYIEVKTERGWVREHIHVMEIHLGRRLHTFEVVHHINEDKKDNRLENLSVMTFAEHAILHHIGAKRTERIKQNIKNGIRQRSVNVRLTEEKAEWIRKKYQLGDMTQAEIAKILNVSPMTVSRVVNNQTWN